jgi:hypothetical protein
MRGAMKEIVLTQGFVTQVDDADYEHFSQFKWRALVDKRRGKVYATRRTHGSHDSRIHVYLHREILGVTDPKVKVDHRNRDGLDNQRLNLRACTTSQNNMNQRKRRDARSSKYKGVGWHKRDRRFVVEIKLNGKHLHIGYFTDEIEAALAYDAAAREHFGEFALCNFPPKKPSCHTEVDSRGLPKERADEDNSVDQGLYRAS